MTDQSSVVHEVRE